MTSFSAHLHDGSTIKVSSTGDGPALLLPVRSTPQEDGTAETMRLWGADPDLGPNLIAGLSSSHRVISADYEAHRMAHPAPDTLTPETVSADLLAIADAAGAGTFGYYGYSWLAMSGLQLALRTDRLWALVMGGYPPVDGPYAAMLAVTRAAHRASLRPAANPETPAEPGDWSSTQISTSADQTQQFLTLYEYLAAFDNTDVPSLSVPRFCFAGSADRIEYGPDWGDTVVEIAEPLRCRSEDLSGAGWQIELIEGLDHLSAMHSSVVLPLLTERLAAVKPPA
ncbi:alpha/beta hydrolase [Nakamurella silvestris]|nr:alpha/beta hydrolase [Nakamurella silvestris]